MAEGLPLATMPGVSSGPRYSFLGWADRATEHLGVAHAACQVYYAVEN